METEIYVYENDMTFDFVDDMSSGDFTDKSPALEFARELQEKIAFWLQLATECGVAFQLGRRSTSPDSMYSFKVYGPMEALLKWNEKVWHTDEGEFENDCKLTNIVGLINFTQ